MFPPYVPWPVDLTDRVLNIYRFHWLHADMCDPVIMSCSPNTTVSERALAMSPVLLYGSAMGRKLRFSLVAAGIGAAPQAPVLGSQPDYPYDGNVSCAARTLLRYEIPAANGLTAIQEDDVEIGLQRWGLLRNFEGNPHVTINESTAAGHFDVIGATLDGNLAQADCVNNRLIFDPAAMGGNRTRWRIIGAHEAGHALGLSHTGDEDNTITAATEPYLATCLPPNAQTTDDVWTPRIDDDAQLTRVQSPFLNANLGFEYADGVNQAYFWTRTNATTISSTASNGTRSMRVDTNGSFTQSVHVEWPDAVARDVRLQARYRFDSGASGPLNFKLYSRGRNFPPGTNCAEGVQYEDNLNFNKPQAWAGEVLEINVNTTANPTSWTLSPLTTGGTWDDPVNNNRHMHRLRILVSNGASTRAYVDDLNLICLPSGICP